MLSNFHLFPSPIPLKVATSGNPAFITGEGDLTFSRIDNQHVTIHGVLYFELARSTLIPLAVLRKANAFFAYDVAQDCFLIYSWENVLCFKCPLLPSKNKWIFPSPIFTSHVPSVQNKLPLCQANMQSKNHFFKEHAPNFCPISTELRGDL
jgi:hypothetical protein